VQRRKKYLVPNWIKAPLKRCGIYVFNVYYCEKDLQEPFEPVNATIPIEIRRATEEEKDKIYKRADRAEKKRIARYREQGDTCLVALDNKNLAGYTWYNTKIIKLERAAVKKLPPGGAFMCGSVVYPEYRGKKLFQNIISGVIERLKEEKLGFLSNMVDLNNAAAINARQRFITDCISVKVIILPIIGARIIGRTFEPGTVCKAKGE
jgi:hypothetical protein